MKDKRNITLIILILVVVTATSLLLLYSNLNFKDEENKLKDKVGYVDIQLLFDSHPLKKQAEDKLNNLARDLQLELETKLEDVDKEKHQELIYQYQNRLSKKETELIQNVVNNIEKTINEFAQEKEMKAVLKEEDVIDGGQDITELILKRIKNS